jgi:hypothetical protein
MYGIIALSIALKDPDYSNVICKEGTTTLAMN